MRFVQPPSSRFDLDSPLFVGAIIALTIVLVILLIIKFFPSLGQSQAPSRKRNTRSWQRSRRPTTSFSALLAKSGMQQISRSSPSVVATRPYTVRQMEAVINNAYERTPLLNGEESRLLPVLDRIVFAMGQGHRIMAQTSLGEVIRAKSGSEPDAQAAINSKRLDFVVLDTNGLVACAIEYQGTGHDQGNAAERDAIKREALRKAGVPLLEVFSGFTAEILAADLGAILRITPRQH